jgi:hypothetical protein
MPTQAVSGLCMQAVLGCMRPDAGACSTAGIAKRQASTCMYAIAHLSFLDNKAKLCLIKRVESNRFGILWKGSTK